ncbi:MAG: hypothetical protein ACI87W_002722 [Halieaceae bacterium]|jgi:hypothetical protein
MRQQNAPAKQIAGQSGSQGIPGGAFTVTCRQDCQLSLLISSWALGFAGSVGRRIDDKDLGHLHVQRC